MNEENRDIERLLRTNVERQLAHFDWDRLEERISTRLAEVEIHRSSRAKYIAPLAVAAGLVLIASLLVATFVKPRGSARNTQGAAGRAIVSIQESGHGTGVATVVLSGERNHESVARCEVRFANPNRPPRNDRAQPSWCIVTRRETRPNEDIQKTDRAIIACLF